MFKKLQQYKRMIGEVITLARQNNLYLQQLETKLESIELKMRMQNEIAAVNTAAFAEYKNINSGKEVVVVGAGPTLNMYTPLENAVHIGVSRVCQNKNVPLDYHFNQHFADIQTKKIICDFMDDIIDLKCKKFLGIGTDPNIGTECSESFFLQNQDVARYYVDPPGQKYMHPNICFHPMNGGIGVIFPAIQFALFTNPKKLYLVGCDTSSGGYFANKYQSWSHSVEKARGLRWLVSMHCQFKEFAQRWYPDTEIISINPVNLKGLHRDMYTDENGKLVDCEDNMSGAPEFTEGYIKDRIDRSIESVLMDMLRKDVPCKKCGNRSYTMIRGLFDETSTNIEVNCDQCGFTFLCPQDN